jgi:hypothetical protein
MSLFGRLARTLFGGGGAGNASGGRREESAGGNAFWLYVRCSACGEAIRVRVHREHDLSADYEGGGASYYCHKEIIGQSCFRRVKVDLFFNGMREVTERRIDGGEFITREEYDAAQGATSAEMSAGGGSGN